MTIQKTVEQILLKSLLKNEAFTRKVLPFLKSEYYQDRVERLLFEVIHEYVNKYNQLPTRAAVDIALQNKNGVFEEDYKGAIALIQQLDESDSETDVKWLTDIAENWCRERAIHNALLESISILDDKNSKEQRDKGMIPKILTDALGVSFDPNVGHDYLEDAAARYDFYHRVETKIPFDLDYFNKITAGGLSQKTLSIILAGTNVGKSLIMCHFAAAALSRGYKVLYITLEMAEEKIARRIDANLLNVDINDIQDIPKESYDKKFDKLKEKIKGKLIVKEYPPTSASSAHFRHLLSELHLKKKFKPDIIFIDYLNLASSSRIKPGNNVNSYTYIKAIAEELRGLAVEYSVPVVSATQTTRSGYGSSDPGLEDTSESFGLPATADLMFAAINSEELEELGHLQIKQLKNRDNDVTLHKRFIIGIDRRKMKLYDVAEQNIPNEQTPEELYEQVGKTRAAANRGPKPLSGVQEAMKGWKFD